MGMTCNNNELQLLRVTVLSLEGIQLAGSSNSNSKNNDVITTMASWVGFRSSFPSDAMAVSSSHYSSLFSSEEGGDLMAVGSDEVVVSSVVGNGESSGVVLHWHGCEERGRDESGDIKQTPQCPNEQVAQEPVPHLEIKLPSISNPDDNGVQESPRLSDAIEFHICVVCTKTSSVDDQQCIDNEFGENDADSVMMEKQHCRHNQQHVCHGVAHWKLPPSSDYDTRQGGGKIVVLPIQTETPSPRKSNTGFGRELNEDDAVKLSKQAMLSVKVERTCVPFNQFNEKKEQRHYIESEWRVTGNFAPHSIIFNDCCASKEKDNAGFSQLFRRAKPTLSMTAQSPPEKLTNPKPMKNTDQLDEMVGKIVQTFDTRCPGSIGHASSSESRQPREMPTSLIIDRDSHGNNKQEGKQCMLTSSEQPPKKSLSLTIGEKILCGASFADNFGQGLKMVAAAGHHCDEDHVGLYVVDSDSLGSSIATADVMGV